MFTNLNENGRKKMIDFIREFGNERVVANLDKEALASWESKVESHMDLDGDSHLEIGGSSSKSGNPVTMNFSAEDFNVDQDARKHQMDMFIEACFNDNSIEELEGAIGNDDLADRREWGLTYSDYQECLKSALEMKKTNEN